MDITWSWHKTEGVRIRTDTVHTLKGGLQEIQCTNSGT